MTRRPVEDDVPDEDRGKGDVLYRLNDRPPPVESFFVALQPAMARNMFASGIAIDGAAALVANMFIPAPREN